MNMTAQQHTLWGIRQCFIQQASLEEYIALYRDMQPGVSEYWNGFGQPPILAFRAAFDDKEYNRQRQLHRQLIKGRFAGGNVGWIIPEDLELFAALYRKSLDYPDIYQQKIIELIQREGPMTIQHMKEATGYLVKEITPILHRLQAAFLIYEDQYDGEWDRGWYQFHEMFPDANLFRYTQQEALGIILQRFAYRHVVFDSKMAKSFYQISEKKIKESIHHLINSKALIAVDNGYILASDQEILHQITPQKISGIMAMHRNDFLVRSHQHILKEAFHHPDFETLQYLLVDGKFQGASVGKFRYGSNDLEDVLLDMNSVDATSRQSAIIEAIQLANGTTNNPVRYLGQPFDQ